MINYFEDNLYTAAEYLYELCEFRGDINFFASNPSATVMMLVLCLNKT